MSGKHITDQQIRLFMNERLQGRTQHTAAAKAGISERSARRIEQGQLTPEPNPQRHWRTRADPLDEVWESLLVPLLCENPELLPNTLLELLCERYPEQFDHRIQRTLQRRIKDWKLRHGPAKEVMFRQQKIPARLGLSDFTQLKGVQITIAGQPFKHLLYHYRLAFSGWCHVKVTCGGESYAALSSGLQDALWRCGGVPQEHRTDSLSAAFNNLAEKEQLGQRYAELCSHYHLNASRNTPGKSHENGAIESAHGHLKRRITQALLLRNSTDFESLADYQGFIDAIVAKINRHCRTRFEQEKDQLQPLPKRRTHDYAEHRVLVTSASSFTLKRVTYTVPSRYIGQRLLVQLYDERLELFDGHERLLVLPRVYAITGQRARRIDYRHLIDTLVKKPQAFRFSQMRDDLLPTPDYREIWQHVDSTLEPHEACRYIVRLLHLAAQEDCEQTLGRYVLAGIAAGNLPDNLRCRQRFSDESSVVPELQSTQHLLTDYDALLSGGAIHG